MRPRYGGVSIDHKQHIFNRLNPFEWFDLQVPVAYDQLSFRLFRLALGDWLQWKRFLAV